MSQTRGRIARYEIAPFHIEASQGQDDEAARAEQREWRDLIATFAQNLVLVSDTTHLWRKDWAYLHLRTGGAIGPLSILLRRGANRAVRRGGEERLTRKFLDGVVLPDAAEQQARQRGWKPVKGARPTRGSAAR
jgi:hypothetical protein